MKFSDIIREESGKRCNNKLVYIRFDGDAFDFAMRQVTFFYTNKLFNNCNVISVETDFCGDLHVILEKETDIGYDYDSVNE